MNTEFDVMVIGAGMAGLSAAQSLHAAGKRVCVLDKSRGIGGRMATRRIHDRQWDHGAQYFTAQSPVFRAQVSTWLKAKHVARWKAPIAAWNGMELSATNANARYVGTPFMKSALETMTNNISLQLNTQITGIEQKASGWQLKSESNTWLTPQLVIALPAPQTLALLPSGHPATAAIKQVSMEPCWAVMLSSDTPLALNYGGVFVNHGPLSWVAQDTSKPQRSSSAPAIERLHQNWILHATPTWSLAHLERPASDIEALLVAEFNHLLAQWLPESPTPNWIHIGAHRWRYARGAITSTSYEEWGDDGLALAGDWLAGGRVEGAFLSGIKAAQQLIEA